MLLTGAPDAESLQWTEGDLIAPLLPCFSHDGISIRSSFEIDNKWPAWRSIQLERQHLPTGFTPKPHLPDVQSTYRTDSIIDDEASFLNITELCSMESSPQDFEATSSSSQVTQETLSEFYERSFAIHEDLPSSQIIDFDTSNQTSFVTTSPDHISSQDAPDSIILPKTPTKPQPLSGHLTNLEDIPNATYIRSINPQTMTVNLIVGIIAIPPPRTIKARKTGRMLELIEMIVGDETKAGFGINLWLPPSENLLEDLKGVTSDLRPRDVILVRNVALSSFRANIYGQSLRRGLTKIDLLYRVVVDRYDRRGAYSAQELDDIGMTDPQIEKVKRVKEWVTLFVCEEVRRVDGERFGRGGEITRRGKSEALPLDTQ